MLNESWEIEIASPPHREGLVAHVIYHHQTPNGENVSEITSEIFYQNRKVKMRNFETTVSLVASEFSNALTDGIIRFEAQVLPYD